MIGAELDLHNHLTDTMLDAADLIVGFKEYPHTDVVDRARELFELMLMIKKPFLGFYNFSPLVRRKQLIQKLFAINPIISFNLKLTILWILFKLAIKINVNANY